MALVCHRREGLHTAPVIAGCRCDKRSHPAQAGGVDNGFVIRIRTPHRRVNRLAWLAVALLMLAPPVGRAFGLAAASMRWSEPCMRADPARVAAADAGRERRPLAAMVGRQDSTDCPPLVMPVLAAPTVALAPARQAGAAALAHRHGRYAWQDGRGIGCRGPPCGVAAQA